VNYVYEGPGPHQDPVIGLVRPGDVRNFDEEPDWGPWRPLREAMLEAAEATLTPDERGALNRALGTSPTPALSTLTTPATGTEGM